MMVRNCINHINSVDTLHEWYKWIILFFTKHYSISAEYAENWNRHYNDRNLDMDVFFLVILQPLSSI